MLLQDDNRKYRGAAPKPPLYLVYQPEESGQVSPDKPEKVPTWVKTPLSDSLGRYLSSIPGQKGPLGKYAEKRGLSGVDRICG